MNQPKTSIVSISDTHGLHYKMEIPMADILICSGDFSNIGTSRGIYDFFEWFGNLPHYTKVLIAGNHDKGTDPLFIDRAKYEGTYDFFHEMIKKHDIIYLEDSSCEVYANDGSVIKIHGSPVTPTFGRGWAWNRNREEIQKHWDKIPQDIDILVTHGPAFGYGDRVVHNNERVGCDLLLNKIQEIKPKMHIFGHIHEDRGVYLDKDNDITYVNASSLNLRYNPYERPYYFFDWDEVKKCNSEGYDE